MERGAGMSRARRGEAPPATLGSSGANTPAAVGKRTLTQALLVPSAPGRLEAGASGSPDAPIVQREAGTRATTHRLADHDIASLFGSPSSSRIAPVQRKAPPESSDKAAQPGMWEHTFGEASTQVGKLGRVQAPNGVYLRERPLPGAPSPSAPV